MSPLGNAAQSLVMLRAANGTVTRRCSFSRVHVASWLKTSNAKKAMVLIKVFGINKTIAGKTIHLVPKLCLGTQVRETPFR